MNVTEMKHGGQMLLFGNFQLQNIVQKQQEALGNRWE